jgi:hypothetical protein
MTQIRFTTTFCAFLLMAFAGTGINPKLAAAPAPPNINEDIQRSLLRRFVVDVAMDGPTWRMNDGSNPFFPHFTGQLFRGNTFIVSGKLYRGGTLKSGGDFGQSDNPPGPETPRPIGTWVCRGTFNLDIGEIAAGGFPHVTSTQVFTFDSGGTLVSEGPEGGAIVTRAVIGGTGRFGSALGQVVEEPLGVNTSNLFNVRFYFDLNEGTRGHDER